MPITRFKFTDKKENWHLEETFFDNLNLLLGISGVGKTKILKALEFVCQVATESKCKLNGEAWEIGFKYAGQEYQWKFESSLVKPNFSHFAQPKQSSILFEEVVKKEGDKSTTLLKRNDSSFLLNNEEIPALRQNESAINLLSQIETIRPIHQAFKRVIVSEIIQEKHVGSRMNPQSNHVEPPIGLEQFKENSIKLPTVAKAYWLQQQYPDEFDKIKQEFTSIFTTVEDIKVNLTKEAGGIYEFSVNLKEKTSEKWISQWQMSAGMFRTFAHLIEITMAPEESVIVIDELENGLGTNCMPGLTDFILNKTSHLQVILTSHHPYLIRHIHEKRWKLVKRKGGQVSVINALDIPQLQTDEGVDKFIRLTSLPEYEGGIS
ncbi:MAG: ATP-binding protein [Candidatus Parabeggiatoa sp. nov. 2]|nr:MAG: ATP-binding protein [Gammaproteobacteria bacterium]HEC84613.1 ATP-binding protein [Thioploca sp.]